ncbi:MAG TPA: MoxR family ATPase [Saprospiraceae bacterium]|nr:MoxR family ATPase [Saprospiraceae bacterium]HND87795.1 MoxR family ATPase [Saprospiraceae bacterium]
MSENEYLTPPTEPAPLEPTPAHVTHSALDVQPVADFAERAKEAISQVIVGQSELLDLMLVALFTNGHVLLEGVPGIAKTLSAKLLARTVNTGFGRVQFTPDLMPADVVGTPVFNMKTSEFSFKAGPIFSNVVLIDEINRAPAKTQSALFEVMEERQVTVDGHTYRMGSPFFVVATQNPIEQEGTYKLPEAQLDRFLFKVILQYPSLEEEQSILRRFRNDFSGVLADTVQPVLQPADIARAQQIIEQVFIREELLDYIAALVHNTRNNADLFLGASPRASLALMKTAKAVAAMAGRNFVTPDDIRYVSFPVLNHRVILTPEREMEGYTTREIIDDILKKVEVPR